MSLAFYASPIDHDQVLEDKMNKDKMKIDRSVLQNMQQNMQTQSGHPSYALDKPSMANPYDHVRVSDIHKNIQDENDKELSSFYSNEIPNVEKYIPIPSDQYLLIEDQNKVPAKRPDDLVQKIDRIMQMFEEQREIKTGQKNEEIVLFCFLGVFTIYVLDSFVSIGRYTR
jgi:hypothetical protein